MATETALLSGTWRISSTSGLFTQTFSNTVSCSTFIAHELVIAANVSDFVISLAQLSNVQVFGLQANNTVRVNFGGIGNTSHVSNASAGQQCTQFVWIGSAISGLLNVHLANSGSDSSTVRLVFGM